MIFASASAVFADEPADTANTTSTGGVTLADVDRPAPITAVADRADEYGWRLGTDVGIAEFGFNYYLFLPSTAKTSEVKVRYDGNLQLYDQTNGLLYNPGETATLDLSFGECYVYEFDKANNQYLRYTVRVMAGENIPAIYITLDRGDDGLRHINSSHDAVEQGKIFMTEGSGKAIYNGDLTRMKGHGLTSYSSTGQLNTKNSYNINLGTRAELIEGAGKSKKWSLLRIRTTGSYDPTGVSYPMGFYTYDALVGDAYFNITARYVDVYINGEYRGVYILTERMDMNGSIQITDLERQTAFTSDGAKSVNRSKKSDPAISAGIESYTYCDTASVPDGTDITGGYVLEVMCNTYGEYGFKTKNGMYINVKSPSHPTKEQVQYVALYVQSFENALFSETGYNSDGIHYTEYVDVQSFVAQMLTYSFCMNWEIYRTSTYMFIDVTGSRYDILTFGPVWDFETGAPVLNYDTTLFGTSFAYNERQQYIWYEQFWRKADFLKYVTLVIDGQREIIDQLIGKTDGNRIFNLREMLDSIEASQNMNWVRWGQGGSFRSSAEDMIEGVENRYNVWFNSIWNKDKYLLGATVSVEKNGSEYVLTANANGKATKYQWYKIDDDMTEGVEIEGAEDKTFVTDEDGIYYCAVKGPNNACWEYASGRYFRKATIEMFTDPVRASEPDSLGISTPKEYSLPTEPTSPAGMTKAGEYVYLKTSADEAVPGDAAAIDAPSANGILPSKADSIYIIAAVGLALVSAASAIVFGKKRKAH